jgi:ParB-like chromosome segregation protein Spo0J
MVMGDYPLDLVSPVRHVATELGRAAPAALPVSELAAGYQHPNTGDLARVRSQEGCASNTEAEAWLIDRAIAELGSQVEMNGSGYRLTRDVDKVRYPGKKLLHLYDDPYAQFRAPFDPMTGRFSDNIRRNTGKDGMVELRESMREFGWLPDFPAIADERGVVLVGHRRLAVAQELGIEPQIRTVHLGDGDEADARRFALAIASNLGAKPFTPEERKDIAEYLYGERDWSQDRIAEALKVSQYTVSQDLRNYSPPIKTERRGRPKVTAEQEQAIIKGYFEHGKTMDELGHEVLGIDTKRTRSPASVMKVVDQERGRREERAKTAPAAAGTEPATTHECPTCGHRHGGNATDR